MSARQTELFGAAELAQPAKPKAPWPAPVPERVRRHLRELLMDARLAEVMPWADWRLETLSADFGALADRLGPEEAAHWRVQWDAEITRLRAVA